MTIRAVAVVRPPSLTAARTPAAVTQTELGLTPGMATYPDNDVYPRESTWIAGLRATLVARSGLIATRQGA